MPYISDQEAGFQQRCEEMRERTKEFEEKLVTDKIKAMENKVKLLENENRKLREIFNSRELCSDLADAVNKV